MGQSQSGSAKLTNAAVKVRAMSKVFGPPYIMVNKAHGAAIWRAEMLDKKTIAGKKVCFTKIMILDDPSDNDNVWLFMDLDISDAKFKSMLDISKKFGYDRTKKSLWVKGGCMAENIALAKVLTDVAVDNITAENAISSNAAKNVWESMRGNPAKQQEVYTRLCENLAKNKAPKTEKFMDDPWYAVNDPFSSNQPLDIALEESYDRSYYGILDQVYASQKSSDSALAFPRAPTGKPSVENLVGMPQAKKINERCQGGCRERRMLEHITIPKPNKPSKSRCKGGRCRDDMINFDAYRLNYKPGTEIPQLAFFNREKKTLQ